jgi:hypothetical protein
MAVLPQNEISIGNATVVFFQFLGGSIFLAIAESVFTSQLIKELAICAPTVNAQSVVAAGAAAVASVVSPGNLPGVLEAYNKSIVTVYVASTHCFSCRFTDGFIVYCYSWRRSLVPCVLWDAMG